LVAIMVNGTLQLWVNQLSPFNSLLTCIVILSPILATLLIITPSNAHLVLPFLAFIIPHLY
jgi:hypothetical protein